MRLPVPMLMALVMAGCGPAETPVAADAPGPVVAAPAPDAIPQDPSAGASGMDTATWFTDRTGQGNVSRLMYSARHSDEMAINLQCRTPGEVTALIVRTYTGEAPDVWPFTLASGTESLELTGRVARSDSEYLFIEAIMPANGAVLQAMASSGEARLSDAGGATEMNAINDAERGAIVDFVAECRA